MKKVVLKRKIKDNGNFIDFVRRPMSPARRQRKECGRCQKFSKQFPILKQIYTPPAGTKFNPIYAYTGDE